MGIFCWGKNDFGQLGTGDEEIIDFACGGGHTVAITKGCRTFGWGSNTNGQLGHAVKQCFPEPVEIPLGDPVAKVIAGWQCTAYITDGARPIICGGVRAEGPSIADLTMDREHNDGPMIEKGG